MSTIIAGAAMPLGVSSVGRGVAPVLRALFGRGDDIEEALGRVADHVDRVVANEASGPLRAIASEHLATGGKRFRARLVLACGSALGVPFDRSIPFAAACELLHNATLVHDDLQDGDRVRRGEAAVWVRHGAAQAINAGDLLLVLPTLALDGSGYDPALCWYLSRSLGRRAALTACGQSLEQLTGRAQDAGWARYRDAAIGKTGQFFALPVEGAALLAGLSPDQAARLGDAALSVGLLFQLRDDVLDLFGDKGRGARGGDLREGKVSALVVAHLERHPEDRDALWDVLRTPRDATTTAQVDALARLFRGGGALDGVVARARACVDALVEEPVLHDAPALRAALIDMAERVYAPLGERLEAK